MDNVVFWNCSIFSNKLVLYKEYLIRSQYAAISETSRDNLKKNKVKGILSLSSKRQVTKIINNWVSVVDSKVKLHERKNNKLSQYLTFATLTLSDKQVHDDKYIKREMFDLFLKNLKNRFKVVNYLWVAETQKNGNIHFHIIVDRFIDNRDIQQIWNKIQSKHGYTDKYFKNHKHINAPSTDIQSFRKINNIAAYLTKYMTKNENCRLMDGRLWGCSDKLRELKPYTSPVDSEIENLISDLINNKNTSHYISDHFGVINSKSFSHVIQHINFHLDRMIKYYNTSFDWLYSDSIDLSLRDYMIKQGIIQVRQSLTTSIEELKITNPVNSNHFDEDFSQLSLSF